MERAFVFLNGELSGNIEFYRELLNMGGDIYCADGGAVHAHLLGKTPIKIMGDMDSVPKDIMAYYEEKSVEIERFDRDKDFTDGELILEYVSSKEYDEIIVLAAMGGRIDHTLTNINLLFRYKNVRFIKEKEEILSVDGKLTLKNKKGTEVSFIPFTDEVSGITIRGFKFPLFNYTLKRGSSICMSNIIDDSEAEVSFDEGKLLCVIQKS